MIQGVEVSVICFKASSGTVGEPHLQDGRDLYPPEPAGYTHKRSSSLISSYMKRRLESVIKRIIPKRYHSGVVDLYRRCRYFFLSFLYAGDEFECPFCGKHFRKLQSTGLDNPVLREKNVVGAGYRLNAICPRCNSTDRERLIYLYLKNTTNILYENLKILHIAPERNLQKVLMSNPNINYLSAGINAPLAMVKMDIANIEYEDNLFDVIICNHVLEHIQDDRKAMSELYRVLVPCGRAILQVPISLSLNKTYEDARVSTPEEREKVFGQSDHVRIYARDYKNRLEKVGFSVKVYNLTEEFGESLTHKYGLLKDENIYICSKPKRPK